MKRLLSLAIVGALALSACTAPESGKPNEGTPAADGTSVQSMLETYELDAENVSHIIDTLDRLGPDERPTNLMASVRATELALSTEIEEVRLALPSDRFYLSVAPFIDQTHECFNHSLTTCTGELSETAIEVKIVDGANGQVLIDQQMTTFENGFLGFWLPANVEGTISVRLGSKTGTVDFSTDEDAPTCLTTLQLT